MTHRQTKDWARYRQASFLDPNAAERGRVLTAWKIASDPDSRARVEAQFGVDYCKANYPEAYRGGFARVLDKVRSLIPWGDNR